MGDITPQAAHTEIMADTITPVQEATPKDAKVSYMDDPEYHRMADWFDIDYDTRKNPHIAEKLSYLFDWGKEITGAKDRVTIMVHMKQLASQLGIKNPFTTGDQTIKKLYQYARLDQDRRRIEKEMELVSVS